MTLFELLVLLCIAPVGIAGWGFIVAYVWDEVEKRRRVTRT